MEDPHESHCMVEGVWFRREINFGCAYWRCMHPVCWHNPGQKALLGPTPGRARCKRHVQTQHPQTADAFHRYGLQMDMPTDRRMYFADEAENPMPSFHASRVPVWPGEAPAAPAPAEAAGTGNEVMAGDPVAGAGVALTGAPAAPAPADVAGTAVGDEVLANDHVAGAGETSTEAPASGDGALDFHPPDEDMACAVRVISCLGGHGSNHVILRMLVACVTSGLAHVLQCASAVLRGAPVSAGIRQRRRVSSKAPLPQNTVPEHELEQALARPVMWVCIRRRRAV